MQVTCYLCGRDFGRRSFGIHITSCRRKWEEQQRILPRNQRRSRPVAPENLVRVVAGEMGEEELEQFNEAAVKVWNDCVLVECMNCVR